MEELVILPKSMKFGEAPKNLMLDAGSSGLPTSDPSVQRMSTNFRPVSVDLKVPGAGVGPGLSPGILCQTCYLIAREPKCRWGSVASRFQGSISQFPIWFRLRARRERRDPVLER